MADRANPGARVSADRQAHSALGQLLRSSAQDRGPRLLRPSTTAPVHLLIDDGYLTGLDCGGTGCVQGLAHDLQVLLVAAATASDPAPARATPDLLERTRRPLRSPVADLIAVCEAAVSRDGSVPAAWIDRYAHLVLGPGPGPGERAAFGHHEWRAVRLLLLGGFPAVAAGGAWHVATYVLRHRCVVVAGAEDCPVLTLGQAPATAPAVRGTAAVPGTVPATATPTTSAAAALPIRPAAPAPPAAAPTPPAATSAPPAATSAPPAATSAPPAAMSATDPATTTPPTADPPARPATTPPTADPPARPATTTTRPDEPARTGAAPLRPAPWPVRVPGSALADLERATGFAPGAVTVTAAGAGAPGRRPAPAVGDVPQAEELALLRQEAAAVAVSAPAAARPAIDVDILHRVIERLRRL